MIFFEQNFYDIHKSHGQKVELWSNLFLCALQIDSPGKKGKDLSAHSTLVRVVLQSHF